MSAIHWTALGVRRTSRAAAVLGVLVAVLAGVLATGPAALATPATPGPGFVDFSYGTTAATNATAYSNQSKVWFTNGTWWSLMVDPNSTPTPNWYIFQLDVASQTWVTTGVKVDARTTARPDVFWDEATQKLYVVSSNSTGTDLRTLAFVYTLTANPAGPKTYVPANGATPLAPTSVRFASITKANGRVWVAFAQSNQVQVLSSPDGLTWNTPTAITAPANEQPIAGAAGATATTDDIAAVTPVPGGVGVMWSHSSVASPAPAVPGGFLFATNLGTDGTSKGFTAPEAAQFGDFQGDNHLSTVTASDGRVFAAVKTSRDLNPAPNGGDALIEVLVRATDGNWSSHPVSTVSQGRTRPFMSVDEGAQLLRVFTASTDTGGSILESDAPLATAGFGAESTVINSSAAPALNDASSTKQPVDSSRSGLVVLASDSTAKTYAHACIGAACAGAPDGPTVATTTALTQSSARSVVGEAVSLTAAVASAAGAPGGTVAFSDGATSIGAAPVVNGSATLRTAALDQGRHSLVARYNPPSVAFAASASAAVSHGVVPAGSRFQSVAPRRVLSGRTLGPRRFSTLRLAAPAGARAVALNVIATGATRSTGIAACAGNASAAACRAGIGLHATRGQTPAAALSVVPLGPGNTVKLFNSAGRARLVADVQGWYVSSPAQAHLTVLAAGRTVVRGRTVTVRRSVVVRVPPALRPAGTSAVAVTVTASTGARTSAVGVCAGGTSAATCRARPVVYAHRGAAAGNQAIVRLGAGGTLRLAVAGATARVSVAVDGRYTVDLTGSALQSVATGRVALRRSIAARRLVTLRVPGLPAGTTGVALRVTATSVQRSGSVSICAGSTSTAACRAAPALVASRGRTTSSVVFARVGAGGTIRVYSPTGALRLTVDRVGSFGRA
jgi:Bacterial Ig-like domain (group 3)